MNDDFLVEVVAERTEENPAFPEMVDAALHRRQLLRTLAARREKLGLSQTVVAARMNTSQSAVARIEAGDVDVRLSTVERYAAALGHRIRWEVLPQTRPQPKGIVTKGGGRGQGSSRSGPS